MLEIKSGTDYCCLSCSDKEHSSYEVKINRDKSEVNRENIITFNLCKKCLNKLAREFQPYS